MLSNRINQGIITHQMLPFDTLQNLCFTILKGYVNQIPSCKCKKANNQKNLEIPTGEYLSFI
jgi:hypothetical protein